MDRRNEHRIDESVHQYVKNVPAKTLYGVLRDHFLRLGIQRKSTDSINSRLQSMHCVTIMSCQCLV